MVSSIEMFIFPYVGFMKLFNDYFNQCVYLALSTYTYRYREDTSNYSDYIEFKFIDSTGKLMQGYEFKRYFNDL